MKVLYDHQAFTYQNWGGVSKSFCELLLKRPAEMDYDIAIKESDNVHLKESGLIEHFAPISRTFQTFYKKHKLLGREKIYNFLGYSGILHTAEEANKAESIRKIKEGNFDVFHPTFFDDYFLPYLNGKPFVLTVHDLMPEIFDWWKGDPQIANKPILLKKASAIIAVSENTKKDLCRFYDVSEDKVHVIYHGMPEKDVHSSYENIINSPYFLYVGGRGGYKNFNQTINDFAAFHKQHPSVKFVFTGGMFSEQEQVQINFLGLKDSVIPMFVSEHQLACLYSNAIAFVYPSLYEGFGMPILEAFAYGCPVLLNNRSCFPEIGGDAAMYFDSGEGKSTLPELLKLIYNQSSEEREQLKNRGYERLKYFSWEKSSQQLYDIYEQICK